MEGALKAERKNSQLRGEIGSNKTSLCLRVNDSIQLILDNRKKRETTQLLSDFQQLTQK